MMSSNGNSEVGPYVGGQAVIEGVMMRSPRSMAIAVRRADGTIVVREDAWVSIFERMKFLRWPFLRGSVVLVESLYNGIQALNFSAAQAEIDAEQQELAEKNGEKNSEPMQAASQPAEDEPKDPQSWAQEDATDVTGEGRSNPAWTIALSMVLAFSLFKGLPHFLTVAVDKIGGDAVSLTVDNLAFHVVDGMFKLMIFVGYLAGISLIPEIRRVFEYHGAEHKAINTYESGQDLTVENAREWTTFHARCGTSFVLFVLVLSIFVFASVFTLIPPLVENEMLNHVVVLGIKLPLMLPLAGLAYEINRYAARHPDQWWVQALVVPGALMQKITTREPDDDQLEIALAAMRAALAAEARLGPVDVTERASIAKQHRGGQVTVFRDFSDVAARLEKPASLPGSLDDALSAH